MEMTGKVRFARKAFFYVAVVFAVSVAVQVFFAGMAVFVDPSTWSMHKMFVKIIEYLPLVMLIFAFIGRFPSGIRWQSAGMFLLIMAMYATANIPNAGALHPVIALLLFWLSASIATKAWRMAYKTKGE